MTTAEAIVYLRPGVAIRVRLQAHGEFAVHRLDVRRYTGVTPGEGFNVPARLLPELRAALQEIEARVEELGVLGEEAA